MCDEDIRCNILWCSMYTERCKKLSLICDKYVRFGMHSLICMIWYVLQSSDIYYALKWVFLNNYWVWSLMGCYIFFLWYWLIQCNKRQRVIGWIIFGLYYLFLPGTCIAAPYGYTGYKVCMYACMHMYVCRLPTASRV